MSYTSDPLVMLGIWSLLQLQAAHLLSVQPHTAECDRAVPANTQAASQGGNSVSESVWEMHEVICMCSLNAS